MNQNSVALEKKQIREQILSLRKSGQSASFEIDEAISNFLTTFLPLIPSKIKTMATFSPVAPEPDIVRIGVDCRAQGAIVGYPKVDDSKESMMTIRESQEKDLDVGHFKILEPRSSASILSASDLDLILVPCVAVDKAGNRLGRGRGFYDRYLPLAPQALRVAIVSSEQVLEHIPVHPWDQGVDWIFHSQGEICLPTAVQWLVGKAPGRKP